jgi:hypothetical protein
MFSPCLPLLLLLLLLQQTSHLLAMRSLFNPNLPACLLDLFRSSSTARTAYCHTCTQLMGAPMPTLPVGTSPHLLGDRHPLLLPPVAPSTLLALLLDACCTPVMAVALPARKDNLLARLWRAACAPVIHPGGLKRPYWFRFAQIAASSAITATPISCCVLSCSATSVAPINT